MSEPSTWRELLSTIISRNSAREQIASAMHISAITLNRWASGEWIKRLTKSSSARASGSRSVSFDASQASKKEFPTLFSASSDTLEIPYAFIMQVLETNAKTPAALRFWTITHLVLQLAHYVF